MAEDGYLAYVHNQASKDGHMNRNTVETMGVNVSAASEELQYAVKNDYTPGSRYGKQL
jgi:hypothetical protein